MLEELSQKLLKKDFLFSPIGLIIVLVCIAAGLSQVDSFLEKLISSAFVRLALYFVVLAGSAIVWRNRRNALPKVPFKLANKVSIVLAITTEDDECRSRLECDFVSEFRKQIKESEVADLVYLNPPLENYQAVRITKCLQHLDDEVQLHGADIHTTKTGANWQEIHQTIQGNFYLWGKLIRREGSKYVLSFNGKIDQDLPPELSKEVKADYNAFGIAKRLIETGNEIQGFEIEAKFFYIVAKYVLAIATLYRGGTEEAHRFDKSLERDFENTDSFTDKARLVENLRRRLALEHLIFARGLFFEGKVREAESELKKAVDYDKTNGNIYMLASVIEFLVRRNVDTALRYVYQARDCAPDGDMSWQYSEAFLLMYKGQHREGLAVYAKLASTIFEMESDIVEQVIGFNEHIVKIEPKFVESNFILGWVYLHKRQNLDLGIEWMSKFLDLAGNQGRYKLLKIEASKLKNSAIAQRGLNTSVDRLLAVSE